MDRPCQLGGRLADTDREGGQLAVLQPLAACDGGGLANAGQNAIIRVGRVGSKCRWIESFDDKPYPYEQLPQAARNRVDRKQIEPQDFQHRPAKNDRVSNEAPYGHKPRNQLCPVERVAKQQTSYPKSEHGDMVGIKIHLYEHSAQGLKVGRIGAPCFQVLAGKRYLKQYEENHDGNKNGIDYPGSKVSDRNALAVLLLQDREHQYPVSCVANDGHQPEKRGDCYQHAVCRNV